MQSTATAAKPLSIQSYYTQTSKALAEEIKTMSKGGATPREIMGFVSNYCEREYASLKSDAALAPKLPSDSLSFTGEVWRRTFDLIFDKKWEQAAAKKFTALKNVIKNEAGSDYELWIRNIDAGMGLYDSLTQPGEGAKSGVFTPEQANELIEKASRGSWKVASSYAMAEPIIERTVGGETQTFWVDLEIFCQRGNAAALVASEGKVKGGKIWGVVKKPFALSIKQDFTPAAMIMKYAASKMGNDTKFDNDFNERRISLEKEISGAKNPEEKEVAQAKLNAWDQVNEFMKSDPDAVRKSMFEEKMWSWREKTGMGKLGKLFEMKAGNTAALVLYFAVPWVAGKFFGPTAAEQADKANVARYNKPAAGPLSPEVAGRINSAFDPDKYAEKNALATEAFKILMDTDAQTYLRYPRERLSGQNLTNAIETVSSLLNNKDFYTAISEMDTSKDPDAKQKIIADLVYIVAMYYQEHGISEPLTTNWRKNIRGRITDWAEKINKNGLDAYKEYAGTIRMLENPEINDGQLYLGNEKLGDPSEIFNSARLGRAMEKAKENAKKAVPTPVKQTAAEQAKAAGIPRIAVPARVADAGVAPAQELSPYDEAIAKMPQGIQADARGFLDSLTEGRKAKATEALTRFLAYPLSGIEDAQKLELFKAIYANVEPKTREDGEQPIRFDQIMNKPPDVWMSFDRFAKRHAKGDAFEGMLAAAKRWKS